jgi:hypothetical protein
MKAENEALLHPKLPNFSWLTARKFNLPNMKIHPHYLFKLQYLNLENTPQRILSVRSVRPMFRPGHYGATPGAEDS